MKEKEKKEDEGKWLKELRGVIGRDGSMYKNVVNRKKTT